MLFLDFRTCFERGAFRFLALACMSREAPAYGRSTTSRVWVRPDRGLAMRILAQSERDGTQYYTIL